MQTILGANGQIAIELARELRRTTTGELLLRYAQDNLFDSTKFKRRFPAFEVTSYRQGLAAIQRSLTR